LEIFFLLGARVVSERGASWLKIGGDLAVGQVVLILEYNTPGEGRENEMFQFYDQKLKKMN
jgi:hypothetical protein